MCPLWRRCPNSIATAIDSRPGSAAERLRSQNPAAAAHTSAPWHRETYDRFLNERLPALLASRMSLDSYSVEPVSTHTCKVSMARDGRAVETVDIPCPDERGIFEIDGQRRVVLPLASCEELDRAEIRCVGEQVYDFIEPRIDLAQPLHEIVRKRIVVVDQ